VCYPLHHSALPCSSNKLIPCTGSRWLTRAWLWCHSILHSMTWSSHARLLLFDCTDQFIIRFEFLYFIITHRWLTVQLACRLLAVLLHGQSIGRLNTRNTNHKRRGIRIRQCFASPVDITITIDRHCSLLCEFRCIVNLYFFFTRLTICCWWKSYQRLVDRQSKSRVSLLTAWTLFPHTVVQHYYYTQFVVVRIAC